MRKIKIALALTVIISSVVNAQVGPSGDCFQDYETCTVFAEANHLAALEVVDNLPPSVIRRQQQRYIQAMQVCATNYFTCRQNADD